MSACLDLRIWSLDSEQAWIIEAHFQRVNLEKKLGDTR